MMSGPTDRPAFRPIELFGGRHHHHVRSSAMALVPPRRTSPLRDFLKVQIRYTVLPCAVGLAAFCLLLVPFPPGAILLLIVAFVYLLPAWPIVNLGLGYRPVDGAPPLPIPASSL